MMYSGKRSAEGLAGAMDSRLSYYTFHVVRDDSGILCPDTQLDEVFEAALLEYGPAVTSFEITRDRRIVFHNAPTRR